LDALLDVYHRKTGMAKVHFAFHRTYSRRTSFPALLQKLSHQRSLNTKHLRDFLFAYAMTFFEMDHHRFDK
jgi:hypothetical protein